jgi:DNA helicase-2/ATP-dependent DNA helicase PcrA
MTRAKGDLHLTIPQRFFVHSQSVQGDRHFYASHTRFIPDTLLSLFDRSSWPVFTEVVAPNASAQFGVPMIALIQGGWQRCAADPLTRSTTRLI